MKVLSLTEPYATLIKNGSKTIETRSWKTNYRGRLYIHASSTKIPKEYKDNEQLMSLVNLNEFALSNTFKYDLFISIFPQITAVLFGTNEFPTI